MNNKRKFMTLPIILLICISMLAGCGNNTSTNKSNEKEETTNSETSTNTDSSNGSANEIKMDDEQVFIYSDKSDITGLNPLINTSGPDNGFQGIILETLVEKVADENSNAIIKPTAAKDWIISDDGTVYTFNIRENAVWNDGVPVTANDFVYTFRQMATPSVGSTNAWLYEGIILNYSEALYNDGKDPKYNKKPEDIGVKAINDKTVEFTLVKPCGYFLQLLSGAKPVRQDKYEEWGQAYGSSIDKLVTNGPFVIESWDPNVQITLNKNEKYWDAENVKLQKIERKVLQDEPTIVQALLSGDIDVADAKDPNWMKMAKEDGRFNTIVTPDHAPEFYGFNCKNKYFKNKKIRLAFSLSIDREKYVEDLRNGQAEALYSLMPSITNVGDKLYSERVDGRNQIIKILQEKYPDPKALLIEGLKEEGLDPDPAKMEVSLSTRGTTEYSKKSSEWQLQQWKEKLGVTITIDMIEWNIMWDKVDAGDYDICTAGWGPYYNDPNGLLAIYEPENGFFNSDKSGWTGTDAEKFSELLEQASESTDNQERAEILLQAEELLVGTAVIAPTYCKNDTTFAEKYINGYYLNSHTGIDYTKIYTAGRQ
jgi:oligopeptide transport system substrate-binding protein